MDPRLAADCGQKAMSGRLNLEARIRATGVKASARMKVMGSSGSCRSFSINSSRGCRKVDIEMIVSWMVSLPLVLPSLRTGSRKDTIRKCGTY